MSAEPVHAADAATCSTAPCVVLLHPAAEHHDFHPDGQTVFAGSA